MKVTAIKPQVKRTGRYSIFIDGEYTLSLSDGALLKSKLVPGQELDDQGLKQLKSLAESDGLYDRALNYAALRLRSKYEMTMYLRRKKASPALADTILNKLSDIGLLDDTKFARSYADDRQRLRPTSRRKMFMELKSKRVADEIIEAVLSNDESNDLTALRELITRKRKLSRYQDDLKLMQYLSRQGFGYGDIKEALQPSDDVVD